MPIRIDANADFTPANGVTGGNGTAGNPWLIQGWDISGHGYGYCIYIGNTTEHFAIKDCSIHDARQNFQMYYYTESGIILHRVSNGTVSANKVYANDFDGIYLHNSSFVRVAENNITGNRWGVMLMDRSSNNTVSGNDINASTDYGIGLIDSSDNLVSGNVILDSANMGVFLGSSTGNSVIGNSVSNSTDGIYLDMSDGNEVAENNVSGNSNCGIYLWGASGNSIFHNNILGNGNSAHDDSGANSWDNGFPSSGNHWSDYSGIDANEDGIGDSAYVSILGGMGARDRFPFMLPWFRDMDPPIAYAGPDLDIPEGTLAQLDGTHSTDNVGIPVFTWAVERHGEQLAILSGPKPVHNFTLPGIYNITLEAMDSAGNRGVDALVAVVSDNTPPVANAGPDMEVPEGASVVLDGSISTDNMGITDYEWSFNDGSDEITIHGMVAEHVFSLSGEYEIVLTVSDAAGFNDRDEMVLTVIPDVRPPVADAGPDISGFVGSPIVLNATGSSDDGGISNYTWAFTCNFTAVALHGPVVEHVFWAPGNYTVRLTVLDKAGNSGIDFVNITVARLPDVVPEVPSNDSAAGNGTAPTQSLGLSAAQWAGIVALETVVCLAIGVAYLRRRKRPER